MRLTLADVLTLAGDSDELLDALAEVMAPRPATASDVVEYLQIPTGSVFSLPPDQALAYFRAKGLRPTFSYADMLDEAHDEAFTVAKMMDVDMLAHVRGSLDDALANGIPFRQWADEIIPTLQGAGWWGRKMVVDPVTGQSVLAQLGSAGRLKTIFRTNMQAAYAAGQWQEIEANKDVAPWLMYDAVDDHRTRDEHREWDRTVLKVGDPWWNDHAPPNGYNCRCGITQLSDDEVKALNLEPDPPGGPQNGYRDWKNPRTGMLEAIPWGLDPGFAHNPGKSHLKALKKSLKEKVDVLPADMQAAASDGIAATAVAAEDAKELAAAALKAEVAKAQKELAKAAGKAHLAAAVEKAHAQAAAVAKAAEDAKKAIAAAAAAEKQALAKAKLDAIIKAGGANTYEKAALKKLVNDPSWQSADATGRLWMFETLAQNLKAKQLLDTKLAKYKAAVLAGKTPPPNVAKVLDDLEPEAKAAFLAKVDAEVATKKAAEEAAQKAALEKEFDDLVESSKTDPDLALTPAEMPIYEKIVEQLKAVPIDVRLDSFKQYLSGLKATKAKVANEAADALQKEIDGYIVADLPGGWNNPLAQELLTLSKVVETQILDVFPKITTVDKFFHVEKWKKQWAELKAEIVAAKEVAKAEVEVNKDLGEAQNALEALADAGVPMAKQAVDEVEHYIKTKWAIWSLDEKAKFVTDLKTTVEGLKAIPGAPKPAPIPVSASKQWLNVETAANNLFMEVIDAGDNGLADTITHYMGLPNWKSGKWTLKQKKAFIETWKGEHAAWKASKAAPQPAAPPPPAAVATPQAGVDSLLATKAPDPARLTQIGPQKGSNPGGLFQDTTTGEKFYVKWFDSEDRARNELLGGKLYELVGAETPELAVFKWPDGRTALSSRWVDNLKGKQSPDVISSADGAYDYFAADAWLANWDVVGQEFDNLVLKGTKAFRVDVGGALRFRAQGAPKGADFGDDVVEIDTLRKGTRNSQAVAVFRDITDEQILAGVRRVLKPSDDQIRQLVEAFGPTNKAERDALLKTLLARREYLRKRFPAAATQPTRTTITPRPGKITLDEPEAKRIADARMNGVSVKTDGLDVEDHHVLVSTYTGKTGPVTRAAFKLSDAARSRVVNALRPSVKGAASGVPDTHISVDLSSAPANFKQWVVGVNSRTGKGMPLEPKDIERAHATKAAIEASRTELDKLAGKVTGPAEAQRVQILGNLSKWEAELDNFLAKAKAGEVYGSPIGKQDFNLVPSSANFEKMPLPQPKIAKPDWQWTRTTRVEVERMAYEKGRFRVSGNPEIQEWGGEVWVGKGPNGERITFAGTDSVDRALRGQVWIDIPGADAAAMQRAFDSLEDVFGVKAVAPTDLEISEQYLNAFARLRLFRNSSKKAYQEYLKLDSVSDAAARVKQKRNFLELSTGVDFEKTEGWRNRAGIDPAFGNGRRYQVRPDVETDPDWKALEDDHLVFINPNGLAQDAGMGVGTQLAKYMESGGSLLSQTERLRRGIVAGKSPGRDRETGGAAYVFCRIMGRSNSKTHWFKRGFYLKPELMRRLDAIHHPGDRYGSTEEHALAGDRRVTADEMRRAADANEDNEIIFKETVSLFDALEFAVVDDSEVKATIDALRGLGYSKWPDGRKLEDVIIGYRALAKRLKRQP